MASDADRGRCPVGNQVCDLQRVVDAAYSRNQLENQPTNQRTNLPENLPVARFNEPSGKAANASPPGATAAESGMSARRSKPA